MAKGIETSPSNYPREECQIKAEQEDIAVESLKKNGMNICQYEKGETIYQYILHPKDTKKGAGLFLWKLIDFLVRHRDFVLLERADFAGKLVEAGEYDKLY